MIRSLILLFLFPLINLFLISCSHQRDRKEGKTDSAGYFELSGTEETTDAYKPVYSLLVSPENPRPGETFSIVVTGGKDISKAKIVVKNQSGDLKPMNSKTGGGMPCWREEYFKINSVGTYKVSLWVDKKELRSREFQIISETKKSDSGKIRKTNHSWDAGMEELYSAWINALFEGYGEDAYWKSLNEVTQNKEKNFLFNHLSLNEDDPEGKSKVIMQPDCADNPFFFRAYFAWKLNLPFGFHICDRGYLGKSPSTGTWITLESSSSGSKSVASFNSFLRKVMNGVHSGTARTAFDNDRSDYYPVALDRNTLRPGVVYADPYGHTFVIVRRIPQTRKEPGILLAVDAQPDGTIAIKRFWKGNFLFSTKEVVGEPGFKAFRPIVMVNNFPELLKNEVLSASSGYIPFSLQQRKMESEIFYRTMERLINPEPMDPEDALEDLINALHEQLQVRVKSVANGDEFMRSHPGTVIPMPGSAAGIFLTGGNWENYSTPNRDLRLLIAIDAVLAFPERVANYPEDFEIKGKGAGEKMAEKLKELMQKRVAERSFTYTRSDGSSWELTLREILERRAAFEMGWNPNDGPEIRWGAPEGFEERSTCKRKAPAAQLEKMKTFRKWFQQRLHPPT